MGIMFYFGLMDLKNQWLENNTSIYQEIGLLFLHYTMVFYQPNI
jgi:hypothetical protein